MIPQIASATAVPTRRNVLTGIAAGIGVLAARPAFSQAKMEEKPSSAANAKLTSLHYALEYKAAPERIYTALLDSKQFAAFSGMPAEIDGKAGGAFHLFSGMIEGCNVELVENQRIVQAWRPASWDAGIYSIAHFEIKATAAGASLVFDHIGFPAGLHDHLDEGWRGHYWEPLRKYLV